MKLNVATRGEHRGLMFAVVRVDLGIDGASYRALRPWHNGYVRLPDGHPGDNEKYHGCDESVYSEIPGIHGGPTFCGPLSSLSLFDGEDDTGTWVGFDTNHYHDNANTKSAEFVEAECRRFIDALLDGEEGA